MPHGYLLRPAAAFLLLSIAALTLSGCRAVTSPTTDQSYPLETGSVDPTTTCAGFEIPKLVIGVDADVDGRIWGMTPTASGDRRWTLVWPIGFSARRGSAGVEVLDPQGRIAASEGDAISRAQVCPLAGDRLLITAFMGFNMPSSLP